MILSSHTAKVLLHHDFKMYRVQGVTVASTTTGLWIGWAIDYAPVTLVAAIISTLTLLAIVLIGVVYVRKVMERDG